VMDEVLPSVVRDNVQDPTAVDPDPIPSRHQDLARINHPRCEPFRMDCLQCVADLSDVRPEHLLGHVHLLRLQTAILADRRRLGGKVLGKERAGGGVVVVRKDDGCGTEERSVRLEEGREDVRNPATSGTDSDRQRDEW
jgi:hypothetical protein